MNSSTLLVILAVVVVCAVVFVLFSRSGKNKAAEKKADYCTTRLRFVVKNYNQVNEQAVKAAGASGIIRPGKNACQVIVGTKVKSVYDELDKLLK